MKSDTTREKIMQAAQLVFLRKGMDGARMQEIADEAGINKALLHYYFHTKELLFREVFYGVLRQLIPGLIRIFRGDEPFGAKIESIVAEYDAFISSNPILPQFVIREINRDPDQLAGFMTDQGLDFALVSGMIEQEVRKGTIRPITFPHLLTNLVGMVVMPYVGRPLFQRKLFMNDPEKYDQFLRERRSVITLFIQQALIIK
jgi:AcrR family transcriptional regulator